MMKKGTFTPRINALEGITDQEKTLLNLIVRLTNGDGMCFLPDSVVEKELGWNGRKTQRWISSLKDHKFIDTETATISGRRSRKIIILDKTKAILEATMTTNMPTPSRQECRDDPVKNDVIMPSKMSSSINKEDLKNIERSIRDFSHTQNENDTETPVEPFTALWTLPRGVIRAWLRHNLAALMTPEHMFPDSDGRDPFDTLDPEYANLPAWLEEHLDGAAACVLDLRYPSSYDFLAERIARALDRGGGDWRECVCDTVRDEALAYARLHLDEIWDEKYRPFIADAMACHPWLTGMWSAVLRHPLEAAVTLLDDGPHKYAADVEFLAFMLAYGRTCYAGDAEAAGYLGMPQGDPFVPAVLCARCALRCAAWWESQSVRLFGRVIGFDWHRGEVSGEEACDA